VKIFRWFLILQAVGLVAILLYLVLRDSAVGALFARIALVSLLPGSLVGGRPVEWLLWPSSTSRETIQGLAVVFALAINAVVCALIILGLRFRARHRAA
jgi:hypothetical protein